ncbi:hypothetical protein ACFW1M_43175 [Streptomyces inhibens]|uniref:hypothetical protein n=1 Tax=Streptomyces inhibens TaxID=2293571 RepID=UPI0036BFD752
MKLSLSGVAVLSALGLAAAPASAQDGAAAGGVVATVQVKDVKVNDFATCVFTAETPGYLTSGKISASGKIGACGPVPDKCRLQTAS